MTANPRAILAAALFLAIVATATNAAAQPPAPPPAPNDGAGSPWRFQAAVYAWFPQIQGSVSARGETADIDIGFDDMFDLLGNGDLFASGGHFEVGYDRFSFFLDAFGGTARPTSNVTVGPRQGLSGTADVTMNFVFFEFGPAYRVLQWPLDGPGRPISIDVLAGGRFMYFYNSISLRGSEEAFGRDASSTSEWVDPFVGGRFSVPLVGDLDVVFRGDIGGFGAGSELAWNLIGGFQYRLAWAPFGARTSVAAIYKALDFEYQSGSGPDAVVTDLNERGPALGLVFDF
jgi:hypothetical protein